MPTLLRVDSSLYSQQGAASQLTGRFTRLWLARHPGTHVIHRDLAAEPLPHLDARYLDALDCEAEHRSEEQRQLLARGDALLEEVRQAQVLVIGLPLYNFGIPSTLKAWFDYISRPGETFRYDESGPVGLLGGRRVYALSSRGDLMDANRTDPQSDHVRDILTFLGMTDFHFVYADGLTIDEAHRARGMARAEREIEQLVAISGTG